MGEQTAGQPSKERKNGGAAAFLVVFVEMAGTQWPKRQLARNFQENFSSSPSGHRNS
jgi:hypothetical protein